jgi:hypothetical protein
MKRFLAPATAALLALALAPVAGAVTFLDTSFGTPVGGTSARSLALGSTGVSLLTGSEALFFNPAVMIPEARYGIVDLTIGVTQATEDRLVPLYDSFDSFVDETSVALNRNSYGNISGGAIWRLPAETPMAIAVGVFERFDFDYDYFEEFRDPNVDSDPRDQLIQEREWTVDGKLWTTSIGYAAELLKDVRFGGSVHRWSGDVQRDINVNDFQTSRHRIDTVQQELEGWGWTVGAWGRIGERVDLGASFEGPVALDGARTVTAQTGAVGQIDSTTSTGASAEVDYPAAVRLGGTYHPRNALRTTFTLEMERRFWEQLDTPVIGAVGDTVRVRDTWDLRMGLEHVFYNDLPVRFGFRYLENYADPESERAIFSAGIGYRVGGFELDVTGLYHRQTSRQDFLFDPSFGSMFLVPGSQERVEDTILELMLGASRRF